MSAIKRIVGEIQEFYDRLLAAQSRPMTATEKASFEAELALLQAKFPHKEDPKDERYCAWD